MSTSFSVEATFQRGLSLHGTQLLSADGLLKLIAFANSRDVMIDTVEAYALYGDTEVATLEYSIYGPRAEFEHMAWKIQGHCT